MLNLNKKQVGAMLKIMGKDEMKAILCGAKIDEWNGELVLVFTDSYQLTALNLDQEEAGVLSGRMIRRSAIERWYKLATGKDRLDTKELSRVLSEDFAQNNSYMDGSQYPKWQGLVPTEVPTGQSVMGFNADYFKNIQELYAVDGVEIGLHGQLAPMVMHHETGMSLVMPRKV